jgi:hypothetical protein
MHHQIKKNYRPNNFMTELPEQALRFQGHHSALAIPNTKVHLDLQQQRAPLDDDQLEIELTGNLTSLTPFRGRVPVRGAHD